MFLTGSAAGLFLTGSAAGLFLTGSAAWTELAAMQAVHGEGSIAMLKQARGRSANTRNSPAPRSAVTEALWKNFGNCEGLSIAARVE